MHSSPLHKFVGLISSATIAWLSPSLAVMPMWAEEAREWATWFGFIVGVLGACFYCMSMALDVQKKRREEREAHRKEMQEIKQKTDDAKCILRQAEGLCPMQREAIAHAGSFIPLDKIT